MAHLLVHLRRVTMAALLCSSVSTGGAASQSGGAVAFIDVNVVPMDTERVLTRQTVVVQGDRIVAVDPSDEASLPRGTRRVDAQGLYLIPGLIDAHARLLSDEMIGDQYAGDELAVMVSNGVTTIRHAAGRPSLLRLRDRVVADDLLAPVLFVSSPQLASMDAGADFVGITTRTPFEAASTVRGFREEGYDFISLAFANTADIYQGIVLTARGSRTPLVGRVPAAVSLQRALDSAQHIEYLDGFIEALAGSSIGSPETSGEDVWAGQWSLLDDVDEDDVDELVQRVADSGVWNIPLLFAVQVALSDADQQPAFSEFVGAAARDALRAQVAGLVASSDDAAARRSLIELRRRIVKGLHDVDAGLLAGSGDPRFVAPYGDGLLSELQSLVTAGLTPFGALQTATSRPADFLSSRGGGRAEFATVDAEGIRFASSTISDVVYGSIDVGMRADLVLLAANPLDDIGNLAAIEGVMLRGRWLPREELDALRRTAAAALQGAALR